MKEEMILTYRQGEDGMMYPDLKESPQTHYSIGKYGNLRLTFIKAHRPGTYTSLLTQFRLNEYLHGIDLQAKEMLNRIMTQMAQSRGITETMKEQDGLRWAAEMNNIRAAAEETVLHELIYT